MATPKMSCYLFPTTFVLKVVFQDTLSCIVMQEASDALSKTADSDIVSTYQVSSVQLVTNKKLEAFNTFRATGRFYRYKVILSEQRIL